jgi:hypothetical protein
VATIDMTEFAGLVTAPGLLQRNPASCIDVLNWEFPAPGVVRKRRGFQRLTGNAGGPVWKLFTSQLMGLNLLAHVGTVASGTQLRYGDGSGALTALTQVDAGTLTRTVSLSPTGVSTGQRMAMAMCQRNQYVTADEGVARVESNIGAAVVRYAGMPRGKGEGLKSLTAAGTNLADGYARAYRVTWHRKDADGVELGGAPTARWVVANRAYTTGYLGGFARAASMRITIPREFGTTTTQLSTSYYFRLWGTRTYAEATELGNDEMYLVTEQYLTAPDIAAEFVTYVDSTPDSFLLSSPTLHTNIYNFPAQEAGIRQGIVNEDAPPPSANDVAYWQDCMWYANYAYRPRLSAALIAPLADNDLVFLTVGTTVITLRAKLVPAVATDFLIVTGTPTTAIDIRETVRNMILLFNEQLRASSLGAAGYATGTSSTLPGLFYFEGARPYLGVPTQMAFTTAVPTKFQTTFGYSFGAVAPTDAAANGLMFSKPYRADAVPPINQMFAGPVDATILRIYPLRDRLIVFTNYGIFQVTGRTYADFSISPFDLGYRLMAKECVVLCDEKLYAWCFEGIVEIDDGGVRVVSQAIEPTIENLTINAGDATGVDPSLAVGRNNIDVLGFATAYRNQHQVRFHYPQLAAPGDVMGCAYWIAYDTRTKTWTQGQFFSTTISGYLDNRSCGVVRLFDDLLCLGNWSLGADTYLFQEARAYLDSDFQDQARNGATQPVFSSMTLQYQVPIQEGAVHWQQMVINWDAGEVAWRDLPSEINANFFADEFLTGGAFVSPITSLATRIEPPLEVRRSQRFKINLQHLAAEYAGVVGISLHYRPGTKFARRVTP